MKRIRFVAVVSAVLAAAGLAWLAGCGKPASATPGGATAAVFPWIPTNAQPKLPTLKIFMGANETMVAELATTEIQRATGMMFRTNMPENESMLFVFDHPFQASFWMMNTSLPLSAAYIDPNGVILEIHDLQPHDTNSVVASSDNVQYVLETPQGWFTRHNIKPGTAIGTEKGAFKQTFFPNK
jgi:uncharacterized membrane protein (UPF0127 family)